MSNVFRWRITHHADPASIKAEVKALGFDAIADNPHRFVKEVARHRQIKVGVGVEEVVIYVHQEKEAATETYFEYLFEAGYLFGRLSSYIEQLPPRGEGAVEGDASDEDEELEEGEEP